MKQAELNQRCVELYNHPEVLKKMWAPRLFWETNNNDCAFCKTFTKPKVDLAELEVMLSAVVGEVSVCATSLNQEKPGRADFIKRSIVLLGERPLLGVFKAE